jgi:hypothetical protein
MSAHHAALRIELDDDRNVVHTESTKCLATAVQRLRNLDVTAGSAWALGCQ